MSGGDTTLSSEIALLEGTGTIVGDEHSRTGREKSTNRGTGEEDAAGGGAKDSGLDTEGASRTGDAGGHGGAEQDGQAIEEAGRALRAGRLRTKWRNIHLPAHGRGRMIGAKSRGNP